MPDQRRTSGFLDLLVATARQKHAAAFARNAPTPSEAEPPRQVYMAALERIAEALAPHGFRFAKSVPHLTRTEGATRYRIVFQADRNNIAGKHVQFWIHATVENKDAEHWLASSDWPFAARALLGGGQIGNLVIPRGWWSWQIARYATREKRVEHAIRQIETVILPFFAQFSDLTSLARRAAHAEIPGVEDEDAVRLCYWQLGKLDAERCMHFWIAHYQRLRDFRIERDRVLAGGSIRHVTGDCVTRLGTIAGALRIGLDL